MCNIETNSCQSSQPQFSSWNDPGRQTAHHLGIPNLCAATNGKTTHPTRWGMSWDVMSVNVTGALERMNATHMHDCIHPHQKDGRNLTVGLSWKRICKLKQPHSFEAISNRGELNIPKATIELKVSQPSHANGA